MNRRAAGLVISHAILLAIGIAVGNGWRYRSAFEWDNKVSVTSLLSIALTALLSFIFFRSFERQKYSDKLRKDGVLARVAGTREALNRLADLCESTELSHAALVRQIKRMRSEFHNATAFASRVEQTLPSAGVKQFGETASRVNELLTGTPVIPAGPAAPLKKAGDEVLISPGRQAEVEAEITALKRILTDLEIAIIVGM